MPARYELHFVRQGGVVSGHTLGAPNDAYLCRRGKTAHAAFAIRYFPSKKGWVVLDIRQAVEVSLIAQNHPIKTFRGHVRLPKLYPTADAAIMVAMHKLGCAPETG